MEFRVLQYFLAVTREQSISGAAEALHLSQPTLSRQLKELEEELGKQLFLRGSRKITLTEEGMILRKRAEEITALMQMARDEIALTEESISGDVYIGAGETEGVSYLARAARQLQEEYPLIRYHIASGDTIDVMESLDRGLIDPAGQGSVWLDAAAGQPACREAVHCACRPVGAAPDPEPEHEREYFAAPLAEKRLFRAECHRNLQPSV